jgi:hypothetical protein
MAIVSAFLLSSCSNAPLQPEYDEVSLINYNACVEGWVTGAVNSKPFGSYTQTPNYTKVASELCADLLEVNF